MIVAPSAELCGDAAHADNADAADEIVGSYGIRSPLPLGRPR
jgi:hypothetical protein